MGAAYDRLKTRHKRFVDKLCDGMKASDAMRAINPKCRNPRSAAYQMQQIPDVAEAIAERNAELFASTEVTAQRVILGLDRVAHGNIKTLFGADGKLRNVSELSDEEASLIAGFDIEALYEGVGRDRIRIGDIVKVRLKDGVRAGEALARIGGLNKDKMEHGGNVGVTPTVIQFSRYADDPDQPDQPTG